MLQIEQIICGSSVRESSAVIGILSPIPVELMGGVEERDTDSIGGVQAVDVVTAVVVLIIGMLLGDSPLVGGPPFNNGACSATISGSQTLSSLSLICGSVITCDASLVIFCYFLV